MTDFDAKMKALLSETDADFVGDTIDETGFYKASWESLSGTGSGMRKMAWGAIMVFSAITLVSSGKCLSPIIYVCSCYG